MSFVFLEFWNHVYTTVQGLSYITITAGFPTRWKLKEYGCRQLRLMNWQNDSGSRSHFCTEGSLERRDSSPFKTYCSRAQNELLLSPIALNASSPSYHFVAVFWGLRTESWLSLRQKRRLMVSICAATFCQLTAPSPGGSLGGRDPGISGSWQNPYPPI